MEIETEQVAYLMSVIAECIFLMKKDYDEPEVKRSGGTEKKKLTWKLIKRELFSKGSKDKNEDDDDEEEPCKGFDNLQEEASTDDEFSSDGEEGAKASSSRRGSQYLFS